MNTVKELINEALFTVGVKKEGISSQVVDGEFNRNLNRFQLIAAEARLLSPFDISNILMFEELKNSGFSSISSIVAIPTDSNSSSLRYPMESVSLHRINELNRVLVVGGVPEYYYFSNNGEIITFPAGLTNYKFNVRGKIKETIRVGSESDISNIPIVFQNYLMLLLARRLSIIYSRPWKDSLQRSLESAFSSISNNTDIDVTMITPYLEDIRLSRPRNLIRAKN